MLTIRQRQMDTLEQHALAGAQARLQACLAQVFPALAPAQWADTVEKGIAAAVDHGLTRQDEWAAFIALGLGLRQQGPGATPEWVADCLRREDTPGPCRLALVEWNLKRHAAQQPGLAEVLAHMARARQGMLA